MTRVVVLLSAPAGYLSTYYPTETEAKAVVAQWAARQKERNGTEATLFINCDQNEDIVCAVMGQSIIGMYIARDDPTPVERMAAAIEKQAGDGDEWKAG